MKHTSTFERGLVMLLCLTGILVGSRAASGAPESGAPAVGSSLNLADATQLQILKPLERVAYQTNELIDLSIFRSSEQPLPASDLLLTLSGDDGSKLAFTFPLPAVSVEGKYARRTDHLHLDGRLLRPGSYAVEARA